MKKLFLFLTLAAMMLVSPAKNYCQDNNDEAITEAIQAVNTAYLKNDFKGFMENHSFFERVLSMDQKNYLAKYYLAYIEYRLYQFKVSGTKVDVDKYYDTAQEICKELLAAKQFEGEAKTLVAALYMMRLASNPMEAIALAPKIYELLDEAEAAPGSNPRALIVKGVMLMNTPPMFGGSVEKAIEAFTKGLAMYEADKKDVKVTWGYEEMHAWLGQAFEKNNQPDKAKEIYTKALKIAPDFAWVKFNLLPNLEKTNKN
jgi:tetratricopeptide (TPR) repeat protein